MELGSIVIVAAFVFGFALISKRIENTSVTGPMVFVVSGFILGRSGLLSSAVTTESILEVVAEGTLVLLLFTDAIRIDLSMLRRQSLLPARLLGIGLPLTVLLGALIGWWLFPGFGLIEAALLAAVLAPTDAALGQPVVGNPRVPVRIRQALNVESGLNDGLAVPIVTVLIALVGAAAEVETTTYWIGFVAAQIGFGVLIGATVGYIGGRLLDTFASRGWVEGGFRQLGTLAIGVGAFAGATALGGNGFVAAFVSGLVFGSVAREHCEGAYDFAEDEGMLLALITFLFFGAGLVAQSLDGLSWRVVTYAVLSLTVTRMIPVALALISAKLKWHTVFYVGWFGPRGVASILFGLVVVEELGMDQADEILVVVTWTVVLSVLLHGVTAAPLSERYADWFAVHGRRHMPEAEAVDEMPTR